MKITATSDTKPQTATSGLQWDEIRYVYDALGRRLAKIVTENGNFKRATRFIYDGWNVVEERTERQGAGGISKFLFWGEDLSGSFQGAGGVGGLVAHMEKPDSAGWTAYYYHPDANGNIAAVTSPFRALAAKFSYDAFGRTTSQSGPKSGIDLHAIQHRFSTKPMELELATANTTLVPPPVSSGLYYYGYRFYSPNLGRWISRDPIREQGGRNLYNFVGNDGVGKWDLLGNVYGEAIAAAKLAAELALNLVPKKTNCKETCISGCDTAYISGQAAELAAYTFECAQCSILIAPPAVGGCIAYKTAVYAAAVYLLASDHEGCIEECNKKCPCVK